MRNIVSTAALLLSSFALAQTLQVKDIKTGTTKGIQPGVEVVIVGANEDRLREAFKENTRDFKGDDDRIKGSDERFIDDARIQELSENTIDIHYAIKEETSGSTLQLFFNMGIAFLNSEDDAQKYQFMSNLTAQIAKDATRLNYDVLINEQQDVLEDLMDDKKDTVKDVSSAQDDIEKVKKEIAEKENEIKEYERKVRVHDKKIAPQQVQIKDLKAKKQA